MSQDKNQKKDIKFDSTNFNRDFEKDEELRQQKIMENDQKALLKFRKQEITKSKVQVEDIIISSRQVFFGILEAVADKKNPLDVIFHKEDNILGFAVLMLVLGFSINLLGSIMKS
jgi:hypothetical protein